MINDLSTEDQKKRIEAVLNLPYIATVLGVERTRSELIPYLMELLEDNEEVVVALA